MSTCVPPYNSYHMSLSPFTHSRPTGAFTVCSVPSLHSCICTPDYTILFSRVACAPARTYARTSITVRNHVQPSDKMSPPVARASKLYKVYTDGACRGNPGRSAVGAALFSPHGVLVATSSLPLCATLTNNMAEYMACIHALRVARLHEVRRVLVVSDSLLLVRQMRGTYKTSHPRLRVLNQAARRIANEAFDRCVFAHVLRDDNALADSLANAAFDQGLHAQLATVVDMPHFPDLVEGRPSQLRKRKKN